MTTNDFIEKHKSEDIRKLAFLSSKYPEIDMPFALDQISGWQKARTKLPSWADKPFLIYPPHLSMEQCSSEMTALYKASIVDSYVKADIIKRETMVDLTGGFGVDFSFLAEKFNNSIYVERQQHLCDIAKQNFSVLGLSNSNVLCGNGEKYVNSMKPCDFIYIDPARRDDNGARTFAIEDCTPNVSELNNTLLEKASIVMIKLSPMLDWHKAVETLKGVIEVHIVSVKNECKELLIILSSKGKEQQDIKVFCVNDNNVISYTIREEKTEHKVLAQPLVTTDKNNKQKTTTYLFEPNASVMKAGCFGLLCKLFGVKKLAKNTNLYISSNHTIDFPGRKFVILNISSMNKQEIKDSLKGIKKANISVRNFPLTAEELKKKLKLGDGGELFIFGVTDSADNHMIITCKKL